MRDNELNVSNLLWWKKKKSSLKERKLNVWQQQQENFFYNDRTTNGPQSNHFSAKVTFILIQVTAVGWSWISDNAEMKRWELT